MKVCFSSTEHSGSGTLEGEKGEKTLGSEDWDKQVGPVSYTHLDVYKRQATNYIKCKYEI